MAPKDGHLYGFDLDTNTLLYRQPVTRMENEDAPFIVGKPVHFCPGSTGGAEWNGPAYDPQSISFSSARSNGAPRLRLKPAEKIAAVAPGKPWSGEASINPFNAWGKEDPFATGRVGCMPSTPTPAPGDGEKDELSHSKRHDADGRRRSLLR